MPAWKELTSDHEVLSTVSGLKIEFEEPPEPSNAESMNCSFSADENKFIKSEITRLLKKGVIKQSYHVAGEFISPIFLIPKPGGSFRLILNLKKLNSYKPYIHFKMDTISSVLKLVTKNCFMAKIDIKDAYYSVHIDDEYKKFLKFYYDGVLYQFTCLPNGLCSGPRKFTKLLKPPLAVLRSSQCLVSGYIDDLITMHKSDNGCFVNIKRIVSLLGELGFYVHPDKSHFLPTQTLEYLGSIIDSVNMRVYLTDSKKKRTKEYCQKLLSATHKVSLREIAKLLGIFSSSFHAVLFGKLHYRDLERLKIDSLRKNYGNFDSYTTLSANAIADIQWWCDNITSSYSPISFGNPTMTISTDASKLGWGAVCSNSQTGGLFSEVESEQHINVLELKAIHFGLRSLCDSVFNTHIKVLCDNTTTVHCITNMGSCRSIPCDIAVKHIWDWAIRHDNWLTISHIPGILNVEADVESRKHVIKTEWKLSEKIFLDIVSHFQFFPDIDLFASRINTQLATFGSYRPDPCATHVNAFTINWHGQKVYCFPPFACVGAVVQKAIQDKIEGLIVVPNWPNQLWYPLLLQVAVTNPYVILPSREQLFLPNQPSLLHPLHKNLGLLAVLIRT